MTTTMKLKGMAVLVAAVSTGASLRSFASDDYIDTANGTYTALEYIKGNGSAVIITDFTPAGDDKVVTRFMPVTVTGTEFLFCTRNNKSSGADNSFCGLRNGTNIRIYRYHISRHATCSTTTLAANNEYLLAADFSKGGMPNKGVEINGTEQAITCDAANMLGITSYPPAGKLVLLAGHNAGSSVSAETSFSYQARLRLYYFQLYASDGTLKHNLMPAKRNSDDKYGLFDTRCGVFYPQSAGTPFVAAEQGGWTSPVTGVCKKWIGRGDGVSMSDGANWDSGVAPGDGDNLDFTLAPPNAEINADISGVTFGKLWIGDGDIPAFTGSMTVSVCNNRAKIADNASITFAAEDYTWRGTGNCWGDADAWEFDDAAATWTDGNNAIFTNAGATATLAADVTANSLDFSANAVIDGEGVIAAPLVSISSGVTAAIHAPTADLLVKTGAGALILSQDRSDATTLAEGTLALSGTASLYWPNFTLGTDPAKPVRLEFGPTATVSGIGTSETWNIGARTNIVSVLSKAGGNWTNNNIVVGSASGAVTTFLNEGGDLMARNYFRIGDDGASGSTLVVSGGTAGSSSSESRRVVVGYTSEGTLVVTNSGVFSANKSLFVAYGADGTVNVSNGGLVHSGADIVFHFNDATVRGVVNLGEGGVIEAGCVYSYRSGGSATFNLDGGTFRQNGTNSRFFTANDDATAIDVTVSENGGTLDNNGFDVVLPRTITGAGSLAFSGSGTTTVSADQSYAGTTTVKSGTTLSATGVAFAGAIVFENGAAVAPPSIPDGEHSVLVLHAASYAGVDLLPRGEHGNRFYVKDGWLAYGNPPGLVISLR